MSDETATLKDTVVSEPPAAPATETPAADPPAPVITANDDAEAAELGRVLINSGYTKERVNELLEAPGALASLRYAVENDPKEFLAMLQRVNPQVADKFLQTMADTFVDRYDAPPTRKAATGNDNSELMDKVRVLEEKANRLEGEQARRDQAAMLAATQQRYNARVDDLFGQVKDLTLTKSEQLAMRARLDKELSADPTVVQRASKGNFVDVAPTFKKIVDEWVGDKKAAVEAEKTARDRQKNGAFPDFSNGPNSFMPVNVPDSTFDSWDNTEAGFAKALEQYSR